MPFEDTPSAAVALLSRLFSQAVQTRFSGYGASPAQYPVLEQLWREDGLTQHELCARIRIEQPTMANTLKRMVRDGLVRRIPDDNDRRKVRLRATPKARRLREPLEQAMRDVQATMLRDLDPAEVGGCLDALSAMIANLSGDLEQTPLLLEDIVAEPATEPELLGAPIPSDAPADIPTGLPDAPAPGEAAPLAATAASAPAQPDFVAEAAEARPAPRGAEDPDDPDDLTSDADILVLRD